jgi:hypothetical protein
MPEDKDTPSAWRDWVWRDETELAYGHEALRVGPFTEHAKLPKDLPVESLGRSAKPQKEVSVGRPTDAKPHESA